MFKKGLWVFCCLLAAQIAVADQTPKDAAARKRMCEQTVCQHNLHVVLKQKDVGTYDHTFDVFPGTVQPFGIFVVAGQTIYVEADESGDELANLRAVPSISHPEKTLVINLKQTPDGGMVLTTHNPFKRGLKFKMGMMPLEKSQLFKTSSCPVLGGKLTFEQWPYPLLQVVLGQAKFIGADAPGLCD
ncbi:hypothetical protein [Dyella sp. 2RAB6]|uniref:hypothetical protein n=1 Tax=Dyella sp. 2RAB6 TaxID=3232992 RepID=UPI003F924649